MKFISIKNAAVAASLVAASAYANVTLAHTLTGSLGSAAGATDYYLITCAPDAGEVTQRLEAKVKDLLPVAAPLISVQVVRAKLAATATDIGTDGNTTWSPIARVNGGDGSYVVTVSKTQAGAENYSLEYHCLSANGVHTATTLSVQQNQ